MIEYTIFNLVFTLTVIIFYFFTKNSLKKIKISLKISIIILLFSYPWDFFAVKLGAWIYPLNPGLKFFEVPVNDIWFIFLCSMVTTAILYPNNISIKRRNN